MQPLFRLQCERMILDIRDFNKNFRRVSVEIAVIDVKQSI